MAQEIIKKAGAFKPFVNVYDEEVNFTAFGDTLGRYCTYNNRSGVIHRDWGLAFTPIKSIEVELI